MVAKGLEKAAEDTPGSCAYRHCLGALLYRTGKADAAVRRLNEAVELHQKKGLVTDWLFLAMAHHCLGQGDQARRWLDRAAKEKPKASAEAFAWIGLVEWRLLLREAEALLGGAGPQPRR
jgi:tetratricopeptide (TPR) repeat protein